jgi:drug/metabolite transporter (DMT)-like permease
MILLRAFGGWLFERPYLLLTLTTLFWAGNAVAGKLAAGVIPPFTLTGLRWILTASILYLLARPLIADNWDQMKAKLALSVLLWRNRLCHLQFLSLWRAELYLRH